MQLPRIHLNGTPGQRLLDQYIAGIDAVRAAIGALQTIDVNGRDYYPISAEATQLALAEHGERSRALYRVQTELEAIALAISEQLP